MRAKSAESGAKSQYEASKKRFEDSVVRSPISGEVASRDDAATVGNSIAPGVRLARIVDVSSFKLTVGVGEREVGLIDVGAKADILVPAVFGGQTLGGRVSAVAAGSNPATGSCPVVITFRNGFGGRVKSGMSATATIQARKAGSSVVVPSAALVRRGETYAVFLEESGAASVREVILGNRIGPRVEVLSGLKEGEKLVISALSRLRPGSPVVGTLRGDSLRWE